MRWASLIGIAAVMASALTLSACKRPAEKAAAPAAPAAQPTSADAQVPETLVFERVAKTVPPGKISVINGVPINPEDWPVLFVADITKVIDNKVQHLVCTATLVGPRVLLTAAHCVDGGPQNTINLVKLNLPGRTVSAACKMHPDYAAAPYPATSTPRNSADFALCLLSDDLSTINDFKSWEYEVIDRDTAPTKVSQVLVTGYGCTKIDLQPAPDCKPIFGDVDATLRAGGATISHFPTPGAERDYFQARSISDQEAALCPGDSGGPLVSGATLQTQTADTRRIVGVNSSIAFPKCNVKDLTSRFAALGAPSFRAWSDKWIADNNRPVVCGVNLKAGVFPCRG